MSVVEVKQSLGSWNLKLSDKTPRRLLDALTYFGHVVFIPGKVNPVQYGDNVLAQARYVGVYRGRSSKNQFELKGCGLSFWLGDEDNKGDILQTPHTFLSETFANTIRDLLPPHGAITEGTLHSVAGTYNGQHQWQTSREAITYVTDTFSAEWKVNNTGTLDAGAIADLFVTTPVALISRKMPGKDPHILGLPGQMGSERDVEDYSTRVVLLAEGDGASIYTGSADAPSVPFKDLHGNTMWMTRMVSESGTVADNADARAAMQLGRFSGTRNSVTLSTDAYDVKGDFVVGDYVWVFDPDNEFVDTSNQISYRGELLSPLKIRVVEMTWPIQAGYTVAFRDTDGNWFDLTDYYVPEEGSTSITVGEFSRSLTSAGSEPTTPRVNYDTSTPAAPTLNTPFSTSSYINGRGENKARVVVSWSQPLNVDGSTITDGDHYEIQFKTSFGATWGTRYQSFDSTTLTVEELSPATSYDFKVRCVDQNANIGAFSATSTIVASVDVTAPSTPAAATVAGNPIQIQVLHELGKASGGTFNLENDLDHLDVFVGISAGFTPGAGNFVGSISATSSNLDTGSAVIANFPIPDDTTRYVKVIAVDRSGNQSAASSSASVSALLIDTINIADAAITNAKIDSLSASKITAGTITGEEIIIAGGTSGILRSDNFDDTGTGAGWSINGDGEAVITSLRTGPTGSARVAIGDSTGAPSGIPIQSMVWLYTGDGSENTGGYVYGAVEPASGTTRRAGLTLRSPRFTSSLNGSSFVQIQSQPADASSSPTITIQTSDGTAGTVNFNTARVKMLDSYLDLDDNGRLYFSETNGDYISHTGNGFEMRDNSALTGSSLSVGKVYLEDRRIHFQGVANSLINVDYIDFDETDNRFDFVADSDQNFSKVHAGAAIVGSFGNADSAYFGHDQNFTSGAWALRQTDSNGKTNLNAPSGGIVAISVQDDDLVTFEDGGSTTIMTMNNPLPTGTGTPVVSNASQLYRDTSSRRFKENIQPIEYTGDVPPVFFLSPRSFDWKAGVGTYVPRMDGLIAEEVQEFISSAVVTSEDGTVEGLNNNVLVGNIIAGLKYLKDRLDSMQ